MNIPAWLLVLAISSLSFLAATWLITTFIRLSAAWQHFGWLLALVIPAFAVIIVPSGLNVKLPVLPAVKSIEMPAPDLPVFAPETPTTQTFAASNVTEAVQGADMSPEIAYGAIWGLGCLMVLVSLMASHLRISRKLRQAQSLMVPESILSTFAGVRQQSGLRAEVLICDFSAIPFCYGLFRPCIVFPQKAAEWGDEMIRACLAHEFGHLKRGDLISLAVAQCACALVWFNPLAWLGLSRLRAAAESASDDLAIEQPALFQTYASQLVAVAAHAKGCPFAPTTFPMARVGQLRQRIDALIDEKRRRTAPGLWSALLLAGALAAIFVVSLTVELVAAEPEQNGSAVKNKGALHLPSIKVACDGDFRTENGLVIATGNVRLHWRGLRAQGDQLEYDKGRGTLRLASKADPSRRFETLFLLTLHDGNSDSPVSPAIERQTDLSRLNAAKGSPDGGIDGPVQIEGEDNGKFEGGMAIATRNAMLSKGDVTVGADRVEYRPESRRARLLEESSADNYQLIATLDMMDIKQTAFDLAKKYLAAIKEGDEVVLRQLFGANMLSNLSESRRKEIETAWIQDALKSRPTLSKPLDAYTINVMPWNRAGVKVGSPFYWPATPSYYAQIHGPESWWMGIAVFESSQNRMAVIQPLSTESDPPKESGFSVVPEGFPDPRLSNPPIPAKTAPARSEIAAMVNNVPITKAQVNAIVDALPKSKNANPDSPSDELWRSYLDGLIDRLLIFQEWDRMKEKGASMPQYVIEDRINTIVREEFNGDRDKFLEAITKNGYTLESFREYEVLKIIVQAVTQGQLQKMFQDSPAASPEERKQQRKQWLEKLRANAKIQYLSDRQSIRDFDKSTSSETAASLSDQRQEKAANLAAAAANDKAAKDFGLRPFSSTDGQLSFDSDGWTWTAFRGHGYSDLSATVFYRTAQAEPSVEVNQLINRQW